MTMMTLFNAKERDMSEWIDLVKQASNGRLILTNLFRPTGSMLSMMEYSFIA